MITAGLIFIACTAAFAVVATLVQIEERRAARLIGGRVRAVLDVRMLRLEERWMKQWHHISRYLVQLGWYYSIHSLLSALMRVLVSIYDRIEYVFEHNRARTKQLRREFKKHVQQSHLTAIADHRESTALTSEEQTKLLDKRLADDH